MNTWLAQAPAPPLQPLPHPELPEVILPPAPTPMWIYIVGALVLIALLTLVLWLLLRPRKPNQAEPKKPWQTAMRALKELSAVASTQPPGLTSAQVSEVLRQYFLDRYKIPAPFRTSHELFHADGIPATSLRLHRYSALAELWDELSFAPVPAKADEAVALIEKAISHLEEDRL